MKAWPILLVVICLALLAQDQPFMLGNFTHAVPDEILFQMQSDSVVPTTQEGISILRGHAKITTKLMTISADEMDYNTNTGEIKPRGNVRVRLTPGATSSVFEDRSVPRH
jgi:lipopolysaccharide assembly outer membrane protein LptD (OstA)